MSEQFLLPPQESESSQEQRLEPEQVEKAMAEVVLFRVMNLENHSGVMSTDEHGVITYISDNQQFPDQGDFAYSGPNGFDRAATYAYPRRTQNVHMLRVAEDQVVEPYPDEMPGAVYIKGGAEVRAQRIPEEIVNEHVDRINSKQPPLTNQEVVDRMTPKAES